MNSRIWLNNAHASQRDVAHLIRQGSDGAIGVVTSHKQYREDIFMAADEAFVEINLADSDDSHAQYVEWALGVAEDRGVSAMIAMRQRMALVGARDQFAAKGIRIAAGAMTVESIDVCEHKDRFTEIMGEHGVPVPLTIRAEDGAQVLLAERAIAAGGYGVCVKPVLGVYGRGYWRFSDEVNLFDVFSGASEHTIDAATYARAYDAGEKKAPVIVMEHLPGVEYSVDCVCDNGELVAHARRKKISTYQEISTGGPEVEIARAVVRHMRLDGIVNVQTRADRNGNPKVLEVNTRPSGGIGYSAAAGINLPYAAAQMLLGEKVTQVHLSEPVAVRVGENPFVLPETSRMLASAQVA